MKCDDWHFRGPIFFGCSFVLIMGLITRSVHCLMQNFMAKLISEQVFLSYESLYKGM